MAVREFGNRYPRGTTRASKEIGYRSSKRAEGSDFADAVIALPDLKGNFRTAAAMWRFRGVLIWWLIDQHVGCF